LYAVPGSIYDEIADYEDLIDLDKETQKPYDHPDTVPEPSSGNAYQQLESAAVKPTTTAIPVYLELIVYDM